MKEKESSLLCAKSQPQAPSLRAGDNQSGGCPGRRQPWRLGVPRQCTAFCWFRAPHSQYPSPGLSGTCTLCNKYISVFQWPLQGLMSRMPRRPGVNHPSHRACASWRPSYPFLNTCPASHTLSTPRGGRARWGEPMLPGLGARSSTGAGSLTMTKGHG